MPALAGRLAASLRERGYVVDAVGDADTFGYDTTRVETAADAAVAARVRTDIGIADAAIVAPRGPAQAGVVRIIVGKDYAVASLPSPAATK